MPIAYRTVKDLKERTPKVIAAAQKSDVVITSHGKPCVIIRRFSPEELEAAVLLQSRSLRKRLRSALADVEAGRTVQLEEFLDRLIASPK